MTVEQSNRDRQRELYGEPLSDIAARITVPLGLTQARLAQALGLSAPMLSQLLSGHRVKIGNPAVLGRLQALAHLAEATDGLSPEEVQQRIAAIAETSPTLSTVRAPQASVVAGLREAAPAGELARLADLTSSPTLAALLRVAADADG